MAARSKWSLIIAQLGGREDLHWQSPTSIDWRRGCLGNGANQRARLMNGERLFESKAVVHSILAWGYSHICTCYTLGRLVRVLHTDYHYMMSFTVSA